MKNRKLTVESLAELAERMPVLDENLQRCLIGGGNGTLEDPYTVEEYDQMVASGTWNGGYVDGWGYTFSDVTVTGSQGSSNNNDISGDVSGSTYNPNEWGGIDSGFWNAFTGNDSGSTDGSGYWGYGPSGDISGQIPPGYGCGGGGGGWYGGGIDPLKDGVDIGNSKHFTLNTTGYNAFNSQLTKILKSNSVIKNLLGYSDKGIVHMTFGVNNLQAPDNSVTLALTSYPSPESYHIDFNSNFIDSTGWNNPHSGIDNMGYDFSKARNAEEKLLITLAHEAQHANHFARYQETLRNNDNKPHLAAIELITQGYSEEFVDIFFEKNENGIWEHETTDAIVSNMHDYMEKYNGPIIDAALEEYRRDYGY